MSQQLLEAPNALGRGDPVEVRALIAAGADIRYVREHGYNALVDAVHGRDVYRDARLLDLLKLLIASGVDLNAVTSYKESGLRVLSHIGRFDGVRLLLENGADEQQLEWTPLIKAVALGTVDEVQKLARAGAPLEETDWWSRTAWLVALLIRRSREGAAAPGAGREHGRPWALWHAAAALRDRRASSGDRPVAARPWARTSSRRTSSGPRR